MILDTRLDDQSRFGRGTVVACVRTEQGSEEHKPPLSVSFVLVSDECKEDLYRAFPTWHMQYRLATYIAFSPEATDLLFTTPKGELRELHYGEYRVTFAVRLEGREAVAIIKRVAPAGPKPINRSPMKTLALKLAKVGGLAMLFYAAYSMFPLALSRLASLRETVKRKWSGSRKMDVGAYARDPKSEPTRALGATNQKDGFSYVNLDGIEISVRSISAELKILGEVVEKLHAERSFVVNNYYDKSRAAVDNSSGRLVGPTVLLTKSYYEIVPLLSNGGTSFDLAALTNFVRRRSAKIFRERVKQPAQRFLVTTTEGNCVVGSIRGSEMAQVREGRSAWLYCRYGGDDYRFPSKSEMSPGEYIRSSMFAGRVDGPIERTDLSETSTVSNTINITDVCRILCVERDVSEKERGANSMWKFLFKREALGVALLARKYMALLRHKFEAEEVGDRTFPCNSDQSRGCELEESLQRVIFGRLIGSRSAFAMRSVYDRFSIGKMTYRATYLTNVPFEPAAIKLGRSNAVLFRNLSLPWRSLLPGWISLITFVSTTCAYRAVEIKNVLVRNASMRESVESESRMEQLANYGELLRRALDEMDEHFAGEKVLYAYNVNLYRDAEFTASSVSDTQAADVMRLH